MNSNKKKKTLAAHDEAQAINLINRNKALWHFH
jgi:hypothetical protein